MCNSHSLFNYKVLAYKHLSLISLKRGRDEKSLSYLKKLLKYSWLLNNNEIEIWIYECLSRIYFHRNEMDRAIYFQERAFNHKIEENDSHIKKLGLYIVRY